MKREKFMCKKKARFAETIFEVLIKTFKFEMSGKLTTCSETEEGTKRTIPKGKESHVCRLHSHPCVCFILNVKPENEKLMSFVWPEEREREKLIILKTQNTYFSSN